MKAIKERGTMRGQCVGIFFAGIAFSESPVGARFVPPQQLSAPLLLVVVTWDVLFAWRAVFVREVHRAPANLLTE